ncbi:MAG: MotA/TolQ/ExbB proton channel family protein [Longimicrobiales bacterium]
MYGVFAAIIATAPQDQGESGAFAVGDFWSLTQQAGPLRWPIFFVLAFGLVQVFLKLYELIRDRQVSAGLTGADFASMDLDAITRLISRQDESMLSTLQSTMVNVFQTRPGEGLLHDEISNFVVFQQDQFASFRRRMEFLSDTAGALGLMGTVWGMFTVFFQGTAEQDVILRGMGIALITTLLGLVVSIILNFSATELSTFFGKRLDAVSKKSDELRFRLMELAPQPVSAETLALLQANAASAPPAPVQAAVPPTRGAAAPATPAPEAEPAPAAPAWHYVEVAGGPYAGVAGSPVEGIALSVRNRDGQPAPDVPVLIAVASSGGSLDGGLRTLRASSGSNGSVEFGCTLPEQVGTFALDVTLPDQPGSATRVDIAVGAAAPVSMELEGNNQAAVAGMRLPLPLCVFLADPYGNPVAGAVVGFTVEQGEGRFASGNGTVKVTTGADGKATAPFVVSSSAGQNVVAAVVEGTKHAARFIAFGTEV